MQQLNEHLEVTIERPFIKQLNEHLEVTTDRSFLVICRFRMKRSAAECDNNDFWKLTNKRRKQKQFTSGF